MSCISWQYIVVQVNGIHTVSRCEAGLDPRGAADCGTLLFCYSASRNSQVGDLPCLRPAGQYYLIRKFAPVKQGVLMHVGRPGSHRRVVPARPFVDAGVCRDGSAAYAEAIRQTAPEAVQISVRGSCGTTWSQRSRRA
jgi:hypothetical protein